MSSERFLRPVGRALGFGRAEVESAWLAGGEQRVRGAFGFLSGPLMNDKRHMWRLVLIVGCLALAGCTYPRYALLREDIHTICVPVFENTTWRRGLEVELTRAVTEELKLHTNLNFASRKRAESILEGELVAFEQHGVTKTKSDEIILTTITVRVRFRWVDNLTGRDIVPWQTVVESRRYPVTLGESVEEGIFREAAQRIVEKMGKEW